MEGLFKFLFFLAILMYSLISIAVFLLVIKILLTWQPQVQILGLIIYS
jgi:hypothetical protein